MTKREPKTKTFHQVIGTNARGEVCQPECLYTKAELEERIIQQFKDMGYKKIITKPKTIKNPAWGQGN